MMKKEAKMLALRKWFNPDNYDALNDLTIEKLHQEFRYRHQMFVGFKTASEDELETVNEEEEQQIFSGNPLLTVSLKAREASASEHNLESDQHIKHFPVGWLYQAEDMILRSGIVPFSESKRPKTTSPYASYPVSWFWGHKNERLKGRMVLHLDLSGSTDDEIIESVRYLLPKWRKATGVKPHTQKQTFYFGEVMIKKLIDFRIIPLLDLLYWSERNAIKLSDAELSALIYRVGIDTVRGDSQIKETDKPMALKARTREFNNLFTAFIYKNRYLMDMKVSAVMDKLKSDQKSKNKSRDD